MMSEYVDIDDLVVITDTRGTEHETTVRHIFEMNKGVYTAADVVPRENYESMERTVDKLNKSLFFLSTIKRNRAKWVDMYDGWVCTACNEKNDYSKLFNFCPNCGAIMDKDPFDDNPPMEYFESGGK